MSAVVLRHRSVGAGTEEKGGGGSAPEDETRSFAPRATAREHVCGGGARGGARENPRGHSVDTHCQASPTQKRCLSLPRSGRVWASRRARQADPAELERPGRLQGVELQQHVRPQGSGEGVGSDQRGLHVQVGALRGLGLTGREVRHRGEWGWEGAGRPGPGGVGSEEKRSGGVGEGWASHGSERRRGVRLGKRHGRPGRRRVSFRSRPRLVRRAEAPSRLRETSWGPRARLTNSSLARHGPPPPRKAPEERSFASAETHPCRFGEKRALCARPGGIGEPCLPAMSPLAAALLRRDTVFFGLFAGAAPRPSPAPLRLDPPLL